MRSFKVNNLTDLNLIATQIIAEIKLPVLCFYGEMGSGKTTLIKELLKNLNVTENTNSPTFSIANKYFSTKGEIFYHFDFYRLNLEEEAFDMGLEEYLDSKNFCFIEWPEKITSFLPSAFHKITLKNNGNHRIITFE